MKYTIYEPLHSKLELSKVVIVVVIASWNPDKPLRNAELIVKRYLSVVDSDGADHRILFDQHSLLEQPGL